MHFSAIKIFRGENMLSVFHNSNIYQHVWYPDFLTSQSFELSNYMTFSPSDICVLLVNLFSPICVPNLRTFALKRDYSILLFHSPF